MPLPATRLLLSSLLSAHALAAISAEDFFDLDLERLAQTSVTTAARTIEPLYKTASAVTVVRREQIQRMGARDLMDVLRHVPGFATGHTYGGRNYVSVRGLQTTSSEKLLFMLDGHLLNDARSGSAQFQFLDSLPLENIERIEVVQGPGSAVYGANALLGVVNIITRASDDIAGVEASASVEVEDEGLVAARYNLLAGGDLGNGFSGSLNLHYADIPGAELRVDSDAFGRSGNAENERDYTDIQGVLERGGFSLRGRWFERSGEDFWGGLHVLTDSQLELEYGFLELRQQWETKSGLDFTLSAWVDHQESDNFFYVLPPGVIPPVHPLYPWNATGYIANTYAEETNTGAELCAEKQLDAHTVLAGIAWRQEKLHDPSLRANYNPAPLPTVRDVSDDFNWLEEARRDISSVFIQDLWDVSDKLRLTVGARYDYFSDFDGTFNPRVGAAWRPKSNLVLRTSYGSAFRAPDFFAGQVRNNANVQSNPDLDPEQIDTVDLEASWQPVSNLALQLTMFYSELTDLIDTDPLTSRYENLGDATSTGFESRVRWQPVESLWLYLNYNFVDTDFGGTPPAYPVPDHSATAVLDWALTPVLNWHLASFWQSAADRVPGDARGELSSQLRFDTSLSANVGANTELRLSIFNLADRDLVYPARPDTLVDDYPAAGRSLVLAGSYRF